MAGFTFQLEPVLRHRRSVEEQRQRELAELVRQRLDLQTELRRMQRDIDGDKEQLAGSLVGSVDVRRIRQHAAHAHQVTARAQQLAAKLMSLEKQISQAREKVRQAMRGRKAIERLKERRYRQWRNEQQRREHAALDELATQRHRPHSWGGHA